jgi:hypothetical protein
MTPKVACPFGHCAVVDSLLNEEGCVDNDDLLAEGVGVSFSASYGEEGDQCNYDEILHVHAFNSFSKSLFMLKHV